MILYILLKMVYYEVSCGVVVGWVLKATWTGVRIPQARCVSCRVSSALLKLDAAVLLPWKHCAQRPTPTTPTSPWHAHHRSSAPPSRERRAPDNSAALPPPPPPPFLLTYRRRHPDNSVVQALQPRRPDNALAHPLSPRPPPSLPAAANPQAH